LYCHGAHDLCHSKKFGFVVSVLLSRGQPGSNSHGFDGQGSVRLRPLFRALDSCHQIFNKIAGKRHFECSSFSSRTRPCFDFLLAAPGKLHHRMTTVPQVRAHPLGATLGEAATPIQLKLFQRRASSRCATADCDLSLLHWRSAAFSSAAGTSPASRHREAHP